MLPRLSKVAKNKGIMLVIVLIVLMVMAIFSLTIFSQSMSQSKSALNQVDQIMLDQYVKGAFWIAYNSVPNPIPYGPPNPSNTYIYNAPTSASIHGRFFTAKVTFCDPLMAYYDSVADACGTPASQKYPNTGVSIN